MRSGATAMAILLVAVMGVAATQDLRTHRKVLQDTTPATASETMAGAPNATMNAINATGNATGHSDARSRRSSGGGEGRYNTPENCGSISCKKRRLLAETAESSEPMAATEGVNATQAANVTGNATGASTSRGDGWGHGSGSAPVCADSISCPKPVFAETGNATMGAANATNVTGNASDARSRRGYEGADYYSGPGTRNTVSQADEVAATLGSGSRKRSLLAEPAEASETMSATEGMNATKSANATGNATDNRAREGGGSGWGGGASGSAPVCADTISCRKRKLMQAATDMAAMAANETMAAGREAVNATMGAANATNVTGNASDARSRRGFEGADYYSGPGTRNTFSQADQVAASLGSGRKRMLLAEPAEANETMAAEANETMSATEGMNATKAANATGNATSTDARSRRGGPRGGNGDGWGSGRSSSPDNCGSISCLKRKLLQATYVSTTDLAATDGMEPALHSNASSVNATMGATNATGNATDSRSRVGNGHFGSQYGNGGGPSQPRTEFLEFDASENGVLAIVVDLQAEVVACMMLKLYGR